MSYSYQSDDELVESLVSSWSKESRTITFEYFDGAEPFNGDLLVEYVDFTITLQAMTGTTRPIV